jgi:hypothetical protein
MMAGRGGEGGGQQQVVDLRRVNTVLPDRWARAYNWRAPGTTHDRRVTANMRWARRHMAAGDGASEKRCDAAAAAFLDERDDYPV